MTAGQYVITDTADVLFTRSAGWMSEITCRLTGMASHQATSYDATWLVEASIDSGRIEKVLWSEKWGSMQAHGTEWSLFRWLKPTMSRCERYTIQRSLDESIQFERYSKTELILQGADSLLNNVILGRPRQGYDAFVFRKLGDIWKNGVICSKTSNRALIAGDCIPKSSGLEYGSPGDTYRWITHQAILPARCIALLAHSPGWFRHVV